MTNKDAIEFLKNMISQEGGRAIGASDFMLELCGYHVTALRMGIKALEQEKTGHWIITSLSNMAYCSECDYLFRDVPASIVKHFKYCPNCGIRMVEPQESEE